MGDHHHHRQHRKRIMYLILQRRKILGCLHKTSFIRKRLHVQNHQLKNMLLLESEQHGVAAERPVPKVPVVSLHFYPEIQPRNKHFPSGKKKMKTERKSTEQRPTTTGD